LSEQTNLLVIVSLLRSVPHYPGEDEKLRGSSIVRRRGGNGPNTLEVLQQLVGNQGESLHLSLCSVLPSQDSPAVKEIQDSLGPRVDLSCCIHRPEHTEAASSYIIRSLETGSRTIVNYNDLPEMTLSEFISVTETLRNQHCWFHFEGRIPETTLECIRHLRKSHLDAKVSVEVEKPERTGLLDLAAKADVVFYSRTWAQRCGLQSARACLIAQQAIATKPYLLYCTWGEQGATGFDRRTGEYEQVPAHCPKGSEAQDSIGAGDTFTAGILFCLLARPGVGSLKVLEFANKLAGCKVVQEGFQGLVERHQWLKEWTI
jgi:ketohexokinase